ncbi:MAG TPA: ABC transporter substrate-binding protein [Cellulomonas sp.]
MRHSKRWAAPTVVAVAGAMALTACSSSSDESSSSASVDCTDYESYGTYDDAVVTVYGSFVGTSADLNDESWADFEQCTGIDVQYEGDSDYESQITVKVEGGNAPDVAIFPQLGLLERFAESGDLVAAPDTVRENAEAGWSEKMVDYGTVDGTFYAAPFTTSVKSFVWYSPSVFEEYGYEVPTTWDELLDLSDQMVSDGVTPWCEGAEAGSGTGWPLTDWVETLLLGSAGGDAYDEWVSHDIAFDDDAVVEATDLVGTILKDDDYVNGGFGDSSSIVSTAKSDVPSSVLAGTCGMMLSSGTTEFDEGTDISTEGDVYAFAFPTVSADEGAPVIVSGQFVGAFSDRTEVQAFQEFVSSPQWATIRAGLGGYISSNSQMDSTAITDEIGQQSFEILNDPDSVLRFDGSDLMPAEVGTGTFWTEMIEWMQGASTQDTLSAIEASWPTD